MIPRYAPWLVAFLMVLAPKVAQAASCPVPKTWSTGQVITAVDLNANPNAFSSCLNNIDYRNIGSAGIFASQIVPQTAAQATFGGTQAYTFSTAPIFNAPLTQANGGTASTDGSINGVGFTNGTPTRPGFKTDNVNLNIDSFGYSGIGIGYDTAALNQIQFGPNGNWATMSSTNTNLATNLTLPAGYAIQAPSIVATTGFTINTPAQSTGQYIDGGGNTEFYDNTENHSVGVIIYHHTGKVLTNGFQQYVSAGSTTYDVPYDANSVSGSTNTHIEHGSITTGTITSGYACAPSKGWLKSFTATPDIQLTIVGGVGGAGATPYINSRDQYTFTGCIYANTNSLNSGVVTMSYTAIGE